MGTFSLLFKNKDNKRTFSDFKFIEDLKLDEIIFLPKNKGIYSTGINLSTFFTTDKEDILMRNSLFKEIIDNKNLHDVLMDLLPKIDIINELKVQKNIIQDIETSLFTIREIENYTEIIYTLYEFFNEYSPKTSSLQLLKAEIEKIYNDENFITIKNNTKDLVFKFNDIKSMTLGMNLNTQFKPSEAGVISLNTKPIRFRTVIDRLKQGVKGFDNISTVNMPITLNKDLSSGENSQIHMMFLKCMYRITTSSLATWRPLIRKYVLLNTSILIDMYDELIFIKAVLEHLKKIESNKFEYCYPNIIKNFETEKIENLYNIHLALMDNAITNDVTFDKNGRIYVLTGPNHGGKSIYTISVGLLYSFLHLGLPLPCDVATIALLDGIYTYFPQTDENSQGKGRFGMECMELSNASKNFTKNSLVLFDEVFSSTSAYEAIDILISILKAYGVLGLRLVFSTHLHELAASISTINEYKGNISKIDTLVAKLSNDHNRSFKIFRELPEGKSFASDIAKKYNLTTEELLGHHLV